MAPNYTYDSTWPPEDESSGTNSSFGDYNFDTSNNQQNYDLNVPASFADYYQPGTGANPSTSTGTDPTWWQSILNIIGLGNSPSTDTDGKDGKGQVNWASVLNTLLGSGLGAWGKYAENKAGDKQQEGRNQTDLQIAAMNNAVQREQIQAILEAALAKLKVEGPMEAAKIAQNSGNIGNNAVTNFLRALRRP